MALPLQQALHQFATQVTATPVAGQPEGKFAIDVKIPAAGAGGSTVSVDQGTEMVMTASSLDLNLLFKNVRFVDEALNSTATHGGMPIADPAAIPTDVSTGLGGGAALIDMLKKLTHGDIQDPATKAPLPGVPGLVGNLQGTLQLPMEIAKEAANVPVEVSARMTLRDEAGNPTGGVRWSTPVASDANEIQLTAAQLSQQIVGTLTALTYELGTAEPVDKRYVHVEVRVSAMGADTGWVGLPRIPVVVPKIPVPTIVACFRFTNFTGNAFVLLPPESALAEDNLTSVTEALDTLSTTIGSLSHSVDAATFLVAELGGLRNALTAADALRDGVKVRKGDQGNLNDITLQQNPIYSNDMEAEDEISSLLLVGPSARVVKFYNARWFKDDEGQMNVTIGSDLLVRINDTNKDAPDSVPPGRVYAAKVPGMGGVWPANYDKTFHNEISSVKFT